jgi:ATP-dependent RNA helicase HelY
MTSPAERYAASRRRARQAPKLPAVREFADGLPFDLDPFQRDACEALESGSGVLVCAPTGAGKTVVGEFAVHLALAQGRKCFYTTPIKALSNQKYNDLVRVHGPDQVGLLTGDNAINGDAPVVVMTTEVLRNMLYVGSPALKDLAFVVMDEVHYLADRFRGAVWEEVIIHLPESVTLVSLSATVSNAEEFAEWLVTVRGETKVVVTEHRPVPLWQHMLVGRRMFDLFHDAQAAQAHEVHPELLRYTREMFRRVEETRGATRGRRPRYVGPGRAEIVERLDREGLLPAITFVFSRAGCDAAVQQCLQAGLRLTDPEERAEIRRIVETRTAAIPSEDLAVLGYWEWLDGLERGLAAHHAGMLPAFKEVVEELFVRGLVKAVFATETLALGINMPARCVVLERLVKFNGEAHVDLTPGEYTQLTGRAGRRGIDVEGHAVVVWTPEVDPRHVAGLASTRTYPLRSSFRPSYNMAVNLVGSVGRAAARELLESSFAQFQADRSVVGVARQVQRNDEAMTAQANEMQCDLGDFGEYFGIRQRIAEREKFLARNSAAARRAAALESLQQLKIGDVIRVPSGRRAGLAVVLDPGDGGFGEPRPMVLTEDRWAGCGCRSTSTRARHRSGAISPRRCDRSPVPVASRSASAAPPEAVARTTSCSPCATSCANTRATPVPTARTTRAGRSVGPGWRRRPPRCGRRWTAVPGRSRGPSTTSANCWPNAAISLRPRHLRSRLAVVPRGLGRRSPLWRRRFPQWTLRSRPRWRNPRSRVPR